MSSERRIARDMGNMIAKHNMIEEGDRILIGLSGGKDSWTLLDMLLRLKARAPVKFELFAATLDPGFDD
ncbi:MAG: tRNA 2-thiocytidine(32) synthetase TtcA, partial [Nanoarchaeota archaeon]|nr:tRNA 2-thiocytidine(32) synthetase TtcA [Nanoarchaeota archaeon]